MTPRAFNAFLKIFEIKNTYVEFFPTCTNSRGIYRMIFVISWREFYIFYGFMDNHLVNYFRILSKYFINY